MTCFNDSRGIEVRGLQDIIPFVRAKSFEGRFVLTDKGALSEMLQRSAGDLLSNTVDGNLWGIELKTEEENIHGNFFLETWSNRCFGRQTPGWMVTLKTDFLFYYFLNQKRANHESELYIIPFPKLWDWFWGSGTEPSTYRRYPEVPQRKCTQKNKTVGRCVPIGDVRQYVGFKKYLLMADEFVAEEKIAPAKLLF